MLRLQIGWHLSFREFVGAAFLGRTDISSLAFVRMDMYFMAVIEGRCHSKLQIGVAHVEALVDNAHSWKYHSGPAITSLEGSDITASSPEADTNFKRARLSWPLFDNLAHDLPMACGRKSGRHDP